MGKKARRKVAQGLGGVVELDRSRFLAVVDQIASDEAARARPAVAQAELAALEVVGDLQLSLQDVVGASVLVDEAQQAVVCGPPLAPAHVGSHLLDALKERCFALRRGDRSEQQDGGGT